MKTNDLILKLGRHEKQFDALYRELASEFLLSDCALWVLYYILIMEEEVTQQNLQELMMFPKQTINSAVSSLVKKGLIKLEVIPGTRNSKKLLLTESGTKFTDETVNKILDAEKSAVRQFGKDKMQEYLQLQEEYLTVLEMQFAKKGILPNDNAQ